MVGQELWIANHRSRRRITLKTYEGGITQKAGLEQSVYYLGADYCTRWFPGVQEWKNNLIVASLAKQHPVRTVT